MRKIFATLMQNTGTGTPGNYMSVGVGQILSLGSSSWSLDEGTQLTKVSAGDFTIELDDPNDSIWTFITNNLNITGGLLPPYLQLLVDGQQTFLGIIDPSRMVQHQDGSTHSVELSAQDWSVQLANTYLNNWSRPIPKAAASRSATTNLTGYSDIERDLFYGINQNVVGIAGTANWVCVGDKVTCSLTGSTLYTVLKVQYPVSCFNTGTSQPPAMFTAIWLDKSPWPAITLNDTYTQTGQHNTWQIVYDLNSWLQLSATFVRQASSTTDQNYFTVATAVGTTPVYAIRFDTIEGIVTGDVLHLIQGTNTSQTYTVMNVNPELRQVITKEPVTNLSVGNRMYFDTATQAELVFMDAKTILTNAVQPFGIDLSRFVQASTVNPVFGWVPLHATGNSIDLTAASDIQPASSSTVSVISGVSAQYAGTPDNGWTYTGATPNPLTDWTNQLTSAPGSLMTYDVKTYAPNARLRNRCYHDFNWLTVDNGPDPSTMIDSWTPAIAANIPVSIFYDYINMRKITLNNNVITANAWSGSSYGGNTGITWASASVLRQIVNFPTGPTTTSLLAYTSTDTIELCFYGSAGVKSVAVPTQLIGGQLVTTPYGVYIVSATGYGQITYAASTLSIANYAVFPDQITCLWPNTFVARTSSEIVVLGRLDDMSVSLAATQTWMFRLTTIPNTTNPLASINSSELIQEGVPVFAGAMRDPSKADRVLGHLGGLLWQIDTAMPWTIERFNPSGMTAIECIEHVCQLQNAMAIPLPSGDLAIVSRGISETATNLTGIKLIETKNYLSWPNFYSMILVETQDGSYYAESDGQTGGTVLTISGHPMIWHISQAQAMADALCTWFGKPRKMIEQTWFWNNANTPAPWESLKQFSLITVNGSIQYRLMAMSTDFVSGETQVTLIAN